MISKFSLLLFAAVAQVVVSQYQSEQSMTAAQMWDPNTWTMPFYQAAANSWADYFKKAQEASSQLYKQWDKTGAGDMYAIGMQFAQLAAKEAQKTAEEAIKQSQQSKMGGYPMQG